MQTTTKPRSSARRTQDVWRHIPSPLDAIFAPKTVALIGATESESSVGRTIMENLLHGRGLGTVTDRERPDNVTGNGGTQLSAKPFNGTVYPVNPKRATVL